MTEHLIFLLYILVFVSSSIGYGVIFSKIFEKEFLKLNLGYIGIIGIFFITFIAAITSFFYPHNFYHNTILHLAGLASFIFFIKDIVKKNFALCLAMIFIMILGVFVFKNHDDFPYYHLTYALNLSENSFIVGTGAFGHGFKTPSSMFYYHSILYMPGIKYFLFHTGPFFILYFFNIIILSEIINKLKKKNFDFIYFLCLLSFIFINIVFYRISEHGTDRSSQILLIIIFLLFFEIIYSKEKNKNFLINLLFLTIVLAASIKVLYYLYFTLVFFLFFEKKINFNYFFKNLTFLFIIFLFSSVFISKNFLSTGCLIYPAEKTCFEKFEWSIPKSTVKIMNTHYEWWAKSGGGANYKHKLSKEEYVKNFNWVQNWYKKHFVGKISDTLGAILLITLIVILLFSGPSNKKIKRKKFRIYSMIPLLFLLEWFLNHPSMRYGGYILFALPVFIITSRYLEKKKIEYDKIYHRSIFLILITLTIYNLRNLDRIINEINLYDYNIVSSPYFYVPNVKSQIITSSNDITIFKPKNNMCWASKTPCSYNPDIRVKKFLWMKMIYKSDDE